MVLLALCDNASDQGECYPSISCISERCSMSERGVRNHINFLIEKGYLNKQERKGRSNLFFISDPCTWCSPAPHAPLHPMQGGLHLTTKTPAPRAGGAAPRAPITITQPSKEPSLNHQSESAGDLVPVDVEKNIWLEFVKMRARIKAPLTAYAAQLIGSELDKIGGDKNAVLNQSIMSGWKGVFPIKSAHSNPDKIQRHGFEQTDYVEAI